MKVALLLAAAALIPERYSFLLLLAFASDASLLLVLGVLGPDGEAGGLPSPLALLADGEARLPEAEEVEALGYLSLFFLGVLGCWR